MTAAKSSPERSQLDAAIEAAARRLVSQRTEGGFYDGFSDAGVAFDAANILLARFVGDRWPDEPSRAEAKVRHILTGRHPSGAFRLYPGGPPSVEATRIVVLALRRMSEVHGSTFPEGLREEIARASRDGEVAIESPPEDVFDITYFVGFRTMLEALDESAGGTSRLLPTPKLALLLPVMFAELLPRATRRRTERVLYPFISVLPPLVARSAMHAAETTNVGTRLERLLERLPPFLRRQKIRAGRRAARWLLERQDSTGGFYYSPLYTYLFIAALRSAVEASDTPALEPRANEAIARALDYIREREADRPTGISTSFVASDVWDTAAVATAFLEAPDRAMPGGSFVEDLAAYVLREQSPSGGFSYGRGSHYPDVDSTGLALGLFAAVLLRNPRSSNRDALLGAIATGLDFLWKRRSSAGGFNAWTVRRGATPPPAPTELASLLFDDSSSDVTARVLVSLARIDDLVRADAGAASVLGRSRLGRVARMRQRGLRYLLATRDPETGFWHARWTLGYVIGTRFVFDALERHPEIADELPRLRDEAAATLLRVQNADGGFGESPRSDMEKRFTPSTSSAALVTAAAFGILRDARGEAAAAGASRALDFLLRTQTPEGSWPEVSLCTQFAGLYASYELMTQVALTTTLFRARRPR